MNMKLEIPKKGKFPLTFKFEEKPSVTVVLDIFKQCQDNAITDPRFESLSSVVSASEWGELWLLPSQAVSCQSDNLVLASVLKKNHLYQAVLQLLSEILTIMSKLIRNSKESNLALKAAESVRINDNSILKAQLPSIPKVIIDKREKEAVESQLEDILRLTQLKLSRPEGTSQIKLNQSFFENLGVQLVINRERVQNCFSVNFNTNRQNYGVLRITAISRDPLFKQPFVSESLSSDNTTDYQTTRKFIRTENGLRNAVFQAVTIRQCMEIEAADIICRIVIRAYKERAKGFEEAVDLLELDKSGTRNCHTPDKTKLIKTQPEVLYRAIFRKLGWVEKGDVFIRQQQPAH